MMTEIITWRQKLGIVIIIISIAAKCQNLIDQSSCRMGLALACVMIIMHDDWSIRLGENRPDRALIHLAAML